MPLALCTRRCALMFASCATQAEQPTMHEEGRRCIVQHLPPTIALRPIIHGEARCFIVQRPLPLPTTALCTQVSVGTNQLSAQSTAKTSGTPCYLRCSAGCEAIRTGHCTREASGERLAEPTRKHNPKDPANVHTMSLTAIPCRMHRISSDLRS